MCGREAERTEEAALLLSSACPIRSLLEAELEATGTWGPCPNSHQEPGGWCSGISYPVTWQPELPLILPGFHDELLFLCRGEGPRRTNLEIRGAPEGLHLLPGCAMAEKAQPSPSAKAGAGQSMAATFFLPVTHKVISTAPTGTAKEL